MSGCIRLELSPAEHSALAKRANILGILPHAYARHLLFDRIDQGDITLTPALYRKAVEACVKNVELPRSQVEALVSVVFNQFHQARQAQL